MMKHRKLKFLIQFGDRDGPVMNKVVGYPKITGLKMISPGLTGFNSAISDKIQ